MAEKIYSAEAEISVLGGLMISPVAWTDVAAQVAESDFADPRNRTIFGAMARVAARGDPIDVVSVGQELDDAGALDAIGGWSVCGQMIQQVPSAANVLYYARVVRRYSVRRKMQRIGIRLVERAAQESDPEAVLVDLRRALDSLGTDADDGFRPLATLLADAVDIIDRRFSGAMPLGLKCGLHGLDKLLGGLHDTDLVVVAGRPAMGKSVLGLQIAAAFACDHRRRAAFFSAEMPSGQHVERLLAGFGRIPLGQIRDGALDDAGWERLTEAVSRLSSAPIFFDETPAPRLDDLLGKARKLHRREPLGLVVVDHAGLVEGGGENRQQAQALVGRSLKALAKELACPVLALVQLNRSLEQRGDKRPILADLRESGEWEQSADVVVMIYRDEVYSEQSVDRGCAELLVRKNRNGEIGRCGVAFLGGFARFENLDGGLPSWAAVPPARGRSSGIDF
jgi:replicative DNA helicase